MTTPSVSFFLSNMESTSTSTGQQTFLLLFYFYILHIYLHFSKHTLQSVSHKATLDFMMKPIKKNKVMYTDKKQTNLKIKTSIIGPVQQMATTLQKRNGQ